MFRTDAGTILNWFSKKGYGGEEIHGCMARCMKNKLTGTPVGSPADLLHLRLGQLGYTGGLQDRMNTFFKRKMGNVNPADAERAFFADTTQDFT